MFRGAALLAMACWSLMVLPMPAQARSCKPTYRPNADHISAERGANCRAAHKLVRRYTTALGGRCFDVRPGETCTVYYRRKWRCRERFDGYRPDGSQAHRVRCRAEPRRLVRFTYYTGPG